MLFSFQVCSGQKLLKAAKFEIVQCQCTKLRIKSILGCCIGLFLATNRGKVIGAKYAKSCKEVENRLKAIAKRSKMIQNDWKSQNIYTF